MAGQRSILSAEALSRCADLGRRISEQHRKRRYPWQPGLEFDWLPSVLEEKLKDGRFGASQYHLPSNNVVPLQVEFGSEYQFFASCSPQQMESACCELLKLGLSEVVMCGACYFMAQVTPPPSHTNCCVFIRQCLLPQLPDTENESASRTLSAAMVEFARKYPRPFVETAVMPLLTRMGEGSWLWDVLNKLVTEPDTQQQDLVSILQVLYGAETWSESTVALLQTVVNQKPPLDTTSLSDLTTATQGQAEKLNSNLKFTKLVLAIIKTYGKEMSQDDVRRFTMVLDCNQTFLKRAASAALKRVTK
uniref:Fanconi Anaemia group E protein C-terminal domain-containing protein n=1 Tax=Branchiostoma floridae TaxID=7739 RepID=C3ZZY3_BRAFL|eukprot:XP_002585893.1 hypothetical protein BRAFLDRAFT_110885 [Branchiostoma floridae]